MNTTKKIIVLILLSVFYFSLYQFTFAQVTSSGYGITTPVNDSQAQNGDIICTYPKGNVRCSAEYDPSIIGVVSDVPAESIEDYDLKSSKIILSSGVVTLRVTTVNGNIYEGDLVTTSLKPGLGQKATTNGYVLGIALEGYESVNTDTVGQIQIALNIHPASGLSGASGNLLRFIRKGLAVPFFEPFDSFRYILAALMVIISFTLGMIYFGRASRAGIEAIGRNPLAKRVIQLTIFMNIALTIVIVTVGLAIAYLILVF